MQQFVVPQFIDVEDKVIGPITVRQFIIMLVGGGFIFVAYKLAYFGLFLLESSVIALITFTLAFIKVNGRPIHYFILNGVQTSLRARLRVWQKIYTSADLKGLRAAKPAALIVPPPAKNRVRASRLAELSLIVDTGGIYEGELDPETMRKPLF